jgi:O-acetyl-ADP-ribose deacetylase (regulator of RNase III)
MVKITYIKGNLFDSKKSLVHCVAKDLKMSRGIAVDFKRKFGGVEEMRKQNLLRGSCGVIKAHGAHDHDRWIFALVTKDISAIRPVDVEGKPKYDDLDHALQELRKKVDELGVKELAMPKIGCGLDHLKWERVETYLQIIFDDWEGSIEVYSI